jgi:hypothetical protein
MINTHRVSKETKSYWPPVSLETGNILALWTLGTKKGRVPAILREKYRSKVSKRLAVRRSGASEVEQNAPFAGLHDSRGSYELQVELLAIIWSGIVQGHKDSTAVDGHSRVELGCIARLPLDVGRSVWNGVAGSN